MLGTVVPLPDYNNMQGFGQLLSLFFSRVWQFFTDTQVPFLGISFAAFWLAVGGVAILITVVKFWFFGVVSHDDVRSEGLRQGKIRIDKMRAND